jgi:hypothetical protein
VARNGLFLRPPSSMLLPNTVADVNHNGLTTIPDLANNNFKVSVFLVFAHSFFFLVPELKQGTIIFVWVCG